MKSRRGLSTLVGAVFFVIAASSAVVYVTYSMNMLDNYAQNIVVKDAEEREIIKEKFEVTKARIETNNKFNVTVFNSGNIPVNVTKMWVTKTNVASPTPNYYTINKVIPPSSSLKDIGQDISFIASTSDTYDVKLITERGNSLSFSTNSDVTANLYTNLHAVPSTVSNGFTTAITLEVVNTLTDNDILTSISPSVTCGSKLTYVSGPTPSSIDTLERGDIAIFRWVYTANGADGDSTTCSAVLRSGGTSVGTITINIKDPEFASQSATSLESEGLTCCKTDDDTLVFHAENLNVPFAATQNNFQLYSGLPEINGATQNIRLKSPISWFTRNDNVTTIDIPSGNWDYNFVYKSDYYPASITTPASLIYFFESPTATLDSSTNNKNISTVSGAVHTEDCDVHGAGCYAFSNGNYLIVPYGAGVNNILAAPETTVGWFKTSQTTRGTIYRIETSQTTQEYYEIAINTAGNLEFKSFTNGNDSNPLTCTSNQTGVLRDNNWYFFAAVRTESGGVITCRLYVINSSGSTISSVTATSNTGSGGGTNKKEQVDVTNENTYIGIDAPNSNGFVGNLGYIMHWEGTALSSSQISDLAKKNYGDAAHKILVSYQKTDPGGNVITNLLANSTVTIPFGDSKNVLSGPAWKTYTFTTSLTNSTDSLGSYHFLGTERLKVKLIWNDNAGADTSLLDMTIDTDDNGYTDSIGTKLTIPTPSTPFLSYFMWNTSTPLQFTVTNAGPNGIWVLFSGTRVIFDGVTINKSYAGLVSHFNKTNSSPNMDATKDGTYMPVGSRGVLDFYMPRIKPETGNLGAVEPITADNQYRMYVSIVGYDNQGSNVFKTFYVGLVSVCPCT